MKTNVFCLKVYRLRCNIINGKKQGSEATYVAYITAVREPKGQY